MSFPQNLARLMRERYETNYQLAKEIGVHQTSIANWLSGKNKPRLKCLGLLAKHYQCTLEELIKDDQRQGNA